MKLIPYSKLRLYKPVLVTIVSLKLLARIRRYVFLRNSFINKQSLTLALETQLK